MSQHQKRQQASVLGHQTAADALRQKHRVQRAFSLLLGVLVLGTFGFFALAPTGTPWLDCLYMTVITLSTVGFTEVIPIQETTALTVFTITLVLAGAGSIGYCVTTVTVLLVEGEILHGFWRKRMERSVARMQNHIIIAGVGGTGHQVVRELLDGGESVVVVENSAQKVETLVREFGESLPVIQGDALDDSHLHAAGITRARGLVATLENDRDNLFLCLSARQMRVDLRIVSKMEDPAASAKFHKVGVDAVVSPSLMGARRLAIEIDRPEMLSFLDTLTARNDESLELAELHIGPGSPLSGQTLRDANLRDRSNCLVIGVRPGPTANYQYNPGGEALIPAQSTLLILGDTSEVETLRSWVAE